MLDKGAEIIRQAKEERKNTKMDKTRIIVVEDNIVYCEFVCNLLAREGFRTVQAYHLSTAKKLLQQASDGDIVVSDLRLPDGDGIDLLRWMRKEGMTQPLIIMTNYAEVHTAVESMKLGSLDYIPKQLVEDKLMPLLHTILKERSIGRNRMPVFARDSSAFQKIMQQIRLVAPTDMSVLIFGENGTGKEHIAHHLHDKSKRAGKPFVPVDCGSLSKDLAPSAFFGHVKGAFTGADSTKKGYFNEAEGGKMPPMSFRPLLPYSRAGWTSFFSRLILRKARLKQCRVSIRCLPVFPGSTAICCCLPGLTTASTATWRKSMWCRPCAT